MAELESSFTDDEAEDCTNIEMLPSEYLPLENAKSPVWEYFGFPAKNGQFTEPEKRLRNRVYCTSCKKSMPYKGNTTNMMVHLQYHHAAIHNQLLKVMKPNDKDKPRATGQHTIVESFEQRVPISRKSSRWKHLTESICYCIAKDMLPLDTIMTLALSIC